MHRIAQLAQRNKARNFPSRAVEDLTPPARRRHPGTITFHSNKTTIGLLLELVAQQRRPVGHNYASSTRVGGGCTKSNHSRGQEESLCYRTDLYYHLYWHPVTHTNCVYSPHVNIFFDDIFRRVSAEVAIISCAAPDCRRLAPGPRINEFLRAKILATFCAAQQGEHTDLVTGEFGCGAYRNDWPTVRGMMLELYNAHTWCFDLHLIGREA